MQTPVWVIRAGERREAHDLLVLRGRIVLSEPGLGNLSELEPTRDEFLLAYRRLRPDESPTGSATIAKGKFFRFVHDMQCGDTVLYLSVKEQHVYVGTVTGAYVFDEAFSETYPHTRSVKWKYVFPKRLLSETARGELGAARSFYMYKRHVDELLGLLPGDKVSTFDDWIDRKRTAQ